MSLTRKALRDMGLTAEQVDGIIAAHLDSIEAVKASAARELAGQQAQAEALRTQLTSAEASGQQQAQEVQAAFDAFRTEVTRKEKLAQLVTALTEAGADPAAAPLLARSADLDALVPSEDGSYVLDGTVEALKAQWGSLFTGQNAQNVQAAFDAFRAQIENQRKRELLTAALTEAGANPVAAPLLAQSADLDALTLSEDGLIGVEEAVAALKAQWAELFAQEILQPLPLLEPPAAEVSPLTKEDVASMSLEDINRHWRAVAELLREAR